jgi:hypothetical protein
MTRAIILPAPLPDPARSRDGLAAFEATRQRSALVGDRTTLVMMTEGGLQGASGHLVGWLGRRGQLVSRPRSLFATALGLVLPVAIAIAWIPVRSRLPNVDLALVLIVAVAGLGALGSRSAVYLAAVSAALWFEFFDTAPFERLGIARSPDVETTLILAVVAVMVGELALRTTRHRGYARREFEKLSSIRSTAELIASGEELVHVIEAVAGDLEALLGLSACSFESTEPDPGRYLLTREGRLVPPERPSPLSPAAGHHEPGAPRMQADDVELPVIVQGTVLGQFVLRFAGGELPQRDHLLIAVTLADNVGAAFLAQAPPPLPPDKQPALRLKLLGSSGVANETVDTVPEGQETAGFSRAAG